MEFKTIYEGMSFVKGVSKEIEENCTNDVQFIVKILENPKFCEISFNDKWNINDENLKTLLVEKVNTGEFTISSKLIFNKKTLTEIIKVLCIINYSLENYEYS